MAMITDEEILALKVRASTDGDTALLLLCERALAGSEYAREECEVELEAAIAAGGDNE